MALSDPVPQPVINKAAGKTREGPKKASPKKERRKRAVPPSRNQGIVISSADPGKISYSEMTKRLKISIDLDAIDVKVTEMKKTSSGAVALAIGRGDQRAEAAEKLLIAVEAFLGADAGVRIRSNTLRLHILGISEDDDPTDIEAGLQREGVPPSQVTLKWARPACRGNQVAAVDVPKNVARRLSKKGRIRVGLVQYRVHLQSERLTRDAPVRQKGKGA